MDNKEPIDEQRELREEIRGMLATVESHQMAIVRAVEDLKQACRGNVSIMHFKDIKAALASFTDTKTSLERAKKLIKNQLQAELKDG